MWGIPLYLSHFAFLLICLPVHFKFLMIGLSLSLLLKCFFSTPMPHWWPGVYVGTLSTQVQHLTKASSRFLHHGLSAQLWAWRINKDPLNNVLGPRSPFLHGAGGIWFPLEENHPEADLLPSDLKSPLVEKMGFKVIILFWFYSPDIITIIWWMFIVFCKLAQCRGLEL